MTATAELVIVAREIADGGSVATPGWIRVADGRIRDRGEGPPPADAAGLPVEADWVLPGLFDMHVHGAKGVDFAQPGADPAPAIAYHHAAGTRHLLASLATGTEADTLARIRELAPLVAAGELAGLHLEGPWLSPERRGAHAETLLRAPEAREVEAILEAGGGSIRMVTMAPELPGAEDAIRRLVAAGVVVAIGHTAATAARTRAALDAGATVVTHLFNGMPPLHHREPGVVGAALTDHRAVVELIADGVHLDDAVVDLVLQSAGGRSVLVSDAMAATGLGDGRYRLAGSDVVVAAGVARLADGGSLAGSTSTLSDLVVRALRRGVPAGQVAAMATARPAATLGISPSTLEPGAAADLVAFHRDGRRQSMKEGRWLAS